jgi:hypothetical protein
MSVTGDSEVLRLRVRQVGPAGAGLPAWLRHELPRADLHPPGLAPSAVLIVRRLDGRVPHAPAARSGWDRDLRADLGSLLARAGRPVAGTVPDDAPAVLFADRAEMTACLVADVLRGVAARRWWWGGPLRAAGRPEVGELLAADVTLLPGAFDLLATWGQADRAARRIATATAGRLLAMLVRAFALAPCALDSAVPAAALAAEPDPATRVWPWEPWLGPAEVPGDLSPEPALLLATSLLLHRAPAAVRSPRFAAALGRPERAWSLPHTQAAGPEAIGSPATSEAAGALSARPAATPAAHPSAAAEDRRAHVVAERDVPAPTDDRGPAGSTMEGSRPAAVRPGGGRVVPPGSPVAAGGEPPPVPDRPPAVDPSTGTPATAPLQAAPAGPAALPPDFVATRLAGVFYLVNLLRQKGYLDQGTVAGPSGWAILEALARGLLDRPDDAGDAWTHDPLWRLLAHLDGRPAALPPGAGRGPVLADLRARLAAALETDPAGAAEVLLLPGEVHHSRTHIDIVADLEAISLPVRRAGLDQDPGWVPVLGRIISFTFVRDGPR